jgi:hypothetical protein
MSISFGNVDKTLVLQGVTEYREVEKKIKSEIFLKLPIQENGGIALTLKTSRFNKVIKGAAIGTMVGVGIGGVGGFAIGGPPGAMAGGLIGGVVGGATGGTIVYIAFEMTKDSKIKQDLTYKLFKDRLVREETIKIFQDQLANDTVFDPLCCPISSVLPEIPMRAPCGHVYDKYHIEQHLDRIEEEDKAAKSGGKEDRAYLPRSSCGINQGVKFTKAELVFEESHITKIMERCLKLREIQRKMGIGLDEGQLNRSILLQGIDAVLTSSRNMMVQVVKIQQAELLDSVNEHKGKVKYSDYLKAQSKLLVGKGLFEGETDEKSEGNGLLNYTIEKSKRDSGRRDGCPDCNDHV